ncbi:glycerophosphoryl diester phosphodiesterase family protein [Metarhizium guizhouense ARSEF 977]|uniref:glycerophosphodiester phosphodiesterase n=1 Tax=Metarhizium guizhouense (strain ARSEF 977) TaxID=1276136 RepID=A0A0B4H0R5_METGA|nr:glycerophosphoryl diester phosphodiesterase family protein [Metarhizium guizhouense ARSEF 977]
MPAVSSLLLAGFVAVSQVSAAPCAPQVKPITRIDVGPRPFFLVNNMTNGPLKSQLESCSEMTIKPSTFSIGHRGGACMQIPEHSRESNLAGARMGAGVLECDVTFTKDLQLVCRHSQCDLHTTTNIVNIPALNAKCTQPFTPAKDGKPASAKCCTSDITLAEFKSLCAKMDGFNASATNPKDFLDGTLKWRTDLYATCGTVMDHKEHIAMVKTLGLRHTPELKAPEVQMPFGNNYTHERFAQQMIDNYKNAGVPASMVMAQSFEFKTLQYWLKSERAFAENAILLDESAEKPGGMEQAIRNLAQYKAEGIKFAAPPFHYLIEAKNGTMTPSAYAKEAKKQDLGLVVWSFERSGPVALARANGDYYYTGLQDVATKDGDMYNLLHFLVKEVGVVGAFSDWSGTVTYFANCLGIGLGNETRRK